MQEPVDRDATEPDLQPLPHLTEQLFRSDIAVVENDVGLDVLARHRGLALLHRASRGVQVDEERGVTRAAVAVVCHLRDEDGEVRERSGRGEHLVTGQAPPVAVRGWRW